MEPKFHGHMNPRLKDVNCAFRAARLITCSKSKKQHYISKITVFKGIAKLYQNL